MALVAAFHAFRFRNTFDRRDAVLLGYGFGGLAIVWWEILEWAVSECSSWFFPYGGPAAKVWDGSWRERVGRQ